MGTLLDEFNREFESKQNDPGFDKEVFKTEFINSRQLAPPEEKAPTRGIIGDIAASAARSAIGVPQMGLEAIRALDRPGGKDPLRGILTPAIETLERIKPGISRETEVSGFRRAITGGIEATLPSLAPIATGAAIGSIIPGIGTAIGAGVGAVVGAVGFGASEIDRVRAEGEQHIKDNNLDGSQADEFRKLVNIAALKSGGVEAGGELIGNLIVAATAGTLAPFKSALKAPIRGTIGALFKTPKKELAVRFGQALAGEEVTEFSQAFLQNKFKKDVGLSDTNSLNAGLDVLGATAVTTLLFFGGAKGINLTHKLRVKNALQDATIDPERRQNAVDEISAVMAEVDGDSERADVFNSLGTIFVQNNQVVSLDATPDQLFDQLQVPTQAERVSIEQERARRTGDVPIIAEGAEIGRQARPIDPDITEEEAIGLSEVDVESRLERLRDAVDSGKTAEQVTAESRVEEGIEKERAVEREPRLDIAEQVQREEIEEAEQKVKVSVAESRRAEREAVIATEERVEPVVEEVEPIKPAEPAIKEVAPVQEPVKVEPVKVEKEPTIEIVPEAKAIVPEITKEPTIKAGEGVAAKKKIDTAAKQTDPAPSQAQIEAGNAKKGHANIQGLGVSIETAKGQERSGTDLSGKPWTVNMKSHYGYIKGTVGRDKEHIDAFVGKNPGSEKVFVVNQINPDTGKFDEHKVMLGFNTEKEARKGYAENYAKGWKGLKSIVPMSMIEFKGWIKGDTTKELEPTVSTENAQAELVGIEAQIEPLNARIARGIPKKSEKLKVQAELKPLLARRNELREIITPTPESVITARKNIKAKGGRLGLGVDPTLLKDLAIVGSHHFNRGVKTFLSWSKAMVSDLGASVKRFLRQIWGNISKGQAKTPIPAEQFTPEEKEAVVESPDLEVSTSGVARTLSINEINEENKDRPKNNKLFTPPPDPVTTKFVPKNVGRPLNPTQQGVFNEKINPIIEGETPANKLDRTLTDISLKVRTGIVDKYAPIAAVSPNIGKILAVTSNPVGALLTLFRHGPLKLTEKIFDVKFDEGGKGLKDIIATLGPELDSFLGWIVANRANKLFPLGKEQNLSKEEIAEMLKLNEGTMTDGRNRAKVYETARKGLMGLNSNVLDIVQEMGLINKEERKTWEEDFYIPFFRKLSEPDANVKGPRNITGLVNQDAVQRLKGAKIPIADMLGNIVLNWSHLLNAAAHNQIGRLTLDQAVNEKFSVDRNVAEKIDIEFKVRRTAGGQFEVTDEALKNKGTFDTKQEANGRVEDLKDKFIASQKKINDDLIYIREDGQKVWYRVNVPILYKSLIGLHERADNSKVMKVMRTFKRMLTFSVTFSPEFKIRNLLRDSIATIAVSPVSMNVFTNVIQGAKGVKEGTLADVRKRAGGGEILFGHTMGTADERLSAMLDRELDISSVVTMPSGTKKLAKEFKRYLQWWNDKGSQLENINRSAIFEQEINKENGSFLEANFQARDVLNFERHGSWQAIKFLIDVVPFLNARIQGLDKVRRGFVDPAQRNQLLAVTGMVALASSLLYLTFKDDDDFKAREDWDRDTYWWFKLPGTETAFRIPKPFEIGVFGTVAERMVEQLADDKAHGALFRERLMFALSETFNFNVIPQAFSPALELAVNKNFFTDRPIESKSMQNLSPSQRKNAWTSETAIAISSGFDKILWDKVVLSPVQIEHLIQGYLGWLGANILGAVDQVFTQPIGGFPGRPSRRIEEFPIIGSFVRTTPARRTRFETIFYEQLNEVNQTYADIRNFRTIGELDKAIALSRQKKDKLRFRKLLNNRQRRLSEINKRIRQIRISKRFSASEKKIKIDRQLEIKNRLLKITVGQIS